MPNDSDRFFNPGAPDSFAQPGSVRQPPPIRSVLKLQRTIGNRAVQELLGMNRPPEPVDIVPATTDTQTIVLAPVYPVAYPKVAAAGGAAGIVFGGAAGIGLSGFSAAMWIAGPVGAVCGLAVGAAVACSAIWLSRRRLRPRASLPPPA